MLKSLMEKLTEIQNMKEDREVTTHIGKYGTEYQGDEDDEDDDGEPKKKAAPAGEKRGRGRPRKDADNTGHVAKHEVDNKMPAWLKGGDAPKGKPDKKAVKKHSLKDWFEHMDAKMLAEAEQNNKDVDIPFDGPYKKDGHNKDQFGNTVKTTNMAKHLAKKGMAAAAAAAKAKPSKKIAEAEVDEAFPDASGAETLTYDEYVARMNKLSDRQLRYHQKKHEEEYGPDTGERGPLNPANLPRHFRLQAKILRDRAKAQDLRDREKEKAKMKLKPKPGEKIAEADDYTTAPMPGAVAVKNAATGKIVGTARDQAAAAVQMSALKKGDFTLGNPEEMKEGGLDNIPRPGEPRNVFYLVGRGADHPEHGGTIDLYDLVYNGKILKTYNHFQSGMRQLRRMKAQGKPVSMSDNDGSLAEGWKQTLRKFDPTIKGRILQKSKDQVDQGIDTIDQLTGMGLTSDDMVSRAMKPNTYFKNAERYADLANKGVAEGGGVDKKAMLNKLLSTHKYEKVLAITKQEDPQLYSSLKSVLGNADKHWRILNKATQKMNTIPLQDNKTLDHLEAVARDNQDMAEFYVHRAMKLLNGSAENNMAEADQPPNDSLMSPMSEARAKADEKKKCPPMSHIKKMCQDGKTVAEICKMHPDCNQKELKQMVADCKNKLEEGAKPDFLDLDKDGNKKEPMTKAAKDKKKTVKEGQTKVVIKGFSAWKAKAEECNFTIKKVGAGEWRAINPKTGSVRGSFSNKEEPGPGSLWGNSKPGTPAMHGNLYLEEGAKPDFLDLDKDGNKKEPMKKAAADKGSDKKDGKKGMSAAQEKFFGKKKTVKEGVEHNHQAARSEGKAHGLRGHSHCGNNYEDMEEARCYHEGFKEGLDEKHGHQYLDEEIPMVAGPGSMVDEEESLNYECSEDFYMEVIQGLIDNNRRNMSPSRKSRVEAYVKKEVTKEGCIFDPQRFEEMYQQIVDFSREIDEAMNDNSSFFNADKRSPIGGLGAPFSSPVDEMMNTIAFESLDRQLNALLDEGMTVSISKGQQGSPDSVSVTASDADSDKLLALVKQAGLGLFGGDEATMHPGATGSNMPSQSAPGSDIAVVDDHDDMMSLIKKVTDGHDDHGHEAGEETCESCGGMMKEGHSCREAVDEEEPNPSGNDEPAEEETDATRDAALATAAGKNFADTDSPLEEEGMDSVENTPNNDGMNSVERGEDEYADEEEDDEEPVELDEATGDQKFDSMMSQMTAEPKYPDRDMLPTSIPELIQWAEKNNKPDHWHFAQWAKKNKFTNVNDALEWFGDNVDPDMPWGPKDFEDPFGRPAAEWLEDAAEHDPKAAELMKVFGCYEKIVFDWPDDYRQMNMPGPKGTDESLTEYANGADDTVESDIDFMINGITGGLNGKKRNVAGNGQSTIPAVAIAHESRLGNPMRESTDLLKDWKKLAGM